MKQARTVRRKRKAKGQFQGHTESSRGGIPFKETQVQEGRTKSEKARNEFLALRKTQRAWGGIISGSCRPEVRKPRGLNSSSAPHTVRKHRHLPPSTAHTRKTALLQLSLCPSCCERGCEHHPYKQGAVRTFGRLYFQHGAVPLSKSRSIYTPEMACLESYMIFSQFFFVLNPSHISELVSLGSSVHPAVFIGSLLLPSELWFFSIPKACSFHSMFLAIKSNWYMGISRLYHVGHLVRGSRKVLIFFFNCKAERSWVFSSHFSYWGTT